MERGLQTIFQQSFPDYARASHLTPRDYRAASSFISCRTAKLGGHMEYCPDGHFQRAHYNSCRHRSCPQCNALQIERWLLRQKSRMLACPHHHLIFTIPHELTPLWLYNRSTVMNLMFHAAKDSLMTLLSDARYLGAMPGLLSAFHSWGRDLSLHPHVHCLVTDGGLNRQGEWLTPRRSHFVSVIALMHIFRGTFSAYLHRGLNRDQLATPGNEPHDIWHALIKRVQRKKWNVHLRERYDHGEGVVTYLARYVRGGPIHNSQLRVSKRTVALKYSDHRMRQSGSSKLSTRHDDHASFISRYLQHVPEKGRQVVRSYGLYANNSREALDLARAVHHQAPVKPAPVLEWQTYIAQVTGEDHRHCPTCGQRLQTGVIARQQGPPTVH